MKNYKTLKRFLAFLLCVAVVITYMPSSVYTLADESSDDATMVQEEPGKTADDDKASDAAPSSAAEVQNETAQVSDTAPEAEAEAAAEPQETPTETPSSQDTAQSESAADQQDQQSGDQGEKAAIKDDKAAADPDHADTSKDETGEEAAIKDDKAASDPDQADTPSEEGSGEKTAADEADGDSEEETSDADEESVFIVQIRNRDGENVIESYEVKEGSSITLPDISSVARDDYNAHWAVGTYTPGAQGGSWNTSKDKVISGSTYTPSKSDASTVSGSEVIGIIPYYEKISYTVTFYTDSSLSEQFGDARAVDADTSYCLNDIPSVPIKSGSAGKWVYDSEEGTADFSNSVTISKDTKVWADYTKNVFTVEYKIGDKTTYATDTYYTGDSLTLPADPVVEGKTFVGWWSGDTQYEGGEEVESDLALQAKFEDSLYVRFVIKDDEGAEIETLSQYFRNQGDKVGTMPQDPFVAGKVFEKWVIDGADTEVTADTEVKDSFTAVAVFRDITVYNITAEYYYINDSKKEFVFNTDLMQVESGDLPYTIEAPSTTQTASDQVSGAPIYYPETPSVEVKKSDFDSDHNYTVRIKYVPYTAEYDYVYMLKDLEGGSYTEIDGSRESNVHGVLNSYVTPTVKTFDYAVLEKAEGEVIAQTGKSGNVGPGTDDKQELKVYYRRHSYDHRRERRD